MEVPQHFCVRWNSYKSNLQTAFPKLLTSEHFVDVTLACEKQFIKCHKIVLSACSVYFESLLINNPCQHPIIFMKDVEFWEIKALVEFMYKGEVNVSQNQLDSLLKSAESLQIRGLSGTKQFVNFEQQEDTSYECMGKRNKSDNENEDEDDGGKRKRKRNDDDEKCVQITSIRGYADTLKDKKDVEDECHKVLKEETVEEEEYNFERNLMDTKDEEEGIGEYNQQVFFADPNTDPGPSGMPDLCSLALNHVECVMEHEKSKTSSPTTNAAKNHLKSQQRHQEHNYTNPPVTEVAPPTAETPTEPPDVGDSHRLKNSGSRSGSSSSSSSQHNASQRQVAQTSSAAPSERHQAEGKNKVIKKDVFNRIRRPEEELQKAAEMVRGGMTFQTASDTFNIPISTIRFYMARRGILPQRRRGRGSSGVRDDDLIHPPFEIIHYRLPDIDKPL